MTLVLLNGELNLKSINFYFKTRGIENYQILENIDELVTFLTVETCDLYIFDFILDISYVNILESYSDLCNYIKVFVPKAEIGKAYLRFTDNIFILPDLRDFITYFWDSNACSMNNVIRLAKSNKPHFSIINKLDSVAELKCLSVALEETEDYFDLVLTLSNCELNKIGSAAEQIVQEEPAEQIVQEEPAEQIVQEEPVEQIVHTEPVEQIGLTTQSESPELDLVNSGSTYKQHSSNVFGKLIPEKSKPIPEPIADLTLEPVRIPAPEPIEVVIPQPVSKSAASVLPKMPGPITKNVAAVNDMAKDILLERVELTPEQIQTIDQRYSELIIARKKARYMDIAYQMKIINDEQYRVSLSEYISIPLLDMATLTDMSVDTSSIHLDRFKEFKFFRTDSNVDGEIQFVISIESNDLINMLRREFDNPKFLYTLTSYIEKRLGAC